MRQTDFLRLALALILPAGVAAAQTASGVTTAPAGGKTAASLAALNPVHQGTQPWDFGVLAQGGVGVTEDRGGFKFLWLGVHAGKVVSKEAGPGLLHGNFEYAVEVFPLWQSYTPTMYRQNCTVIPTTTQASCSVPYKVGGTFTGVSITPAVLRWNFSGTKHWAPWVQGAGGLIWTNHKYPAYGGPPVSTGGTTNSSIGENGPNDDTSVWNFTPQFGVGTHYFVSSNRSIDFGANAIHISSASLGDRNPGVNASVQFTVGYSWWK